MYAQRTPMRLPSLFTEAKEAKFLYKVTLAKENQSPLGLYQTPPTFFFTNPIFVLLICDRSFVLLSLLPRSSLITGACLCPTSSARNGFHLRGTLRICVCVYIYM